MKLLLMNIYMIFKITLKIFNKIYHTMWEKTRSKQYHFDFSWKRSQKLYRSQEKIIACERLVPFTNTKPFFEESTGNTLSNTRDLIFTRAKKKSTKNITTHTFFVQSCMIIKIHMEGHIKSMSERIFYGIYFHSLIRHSAEQCCLFSGRSSYTDKEEAVFNSLKTFTKLTSNHHPDNMIYNALVHFQAHQLLTANEKDKKRNNETFDKFYHQIKQNLS